jgi:light-regulated signal transduction histidine kinase (bacteriophytochrome)
MDTTLHCLPIEDSETDQPSQELNAALEYRAAERIAALERANKELASFCRSVSHDLRAPLCSIGGFIRILKNRHGDRLDPEGKTCLEHVSKAANRMTDLIDDYLNLSRVNHADLVRVSVDLGDLSRRVVTDLQEANPERKVEVVIADNLSVNGDHRLLLIMFENLLGNAWKFTSKKAHARIEIGSLMDADGRQTYYVRDNGAGFDMQYAGNLFRTFQRMHGQHEFPGTGVGLATVQRIIRRHGGRIWAESKFNEGATFFFTLEHGEQTLWPSSGNKSSDDISMTLQETLDIMGYCIF